MRRVLAFVMAGATLLIPVHASAEIVRASSPVSDHDAIAGNPWVPWVVALLAAIGILLVVLDDEEEPVSP